MKAALPHFYQLLRTLVTNHNQKLLPRFCNNFLNFRCILFQLYLVPAYLGSAVMSNKFVSPLRSQVSHSQFNQTIDATPAAYRIAFTSWDV